jgi:hypothetical protein
LKQLGLSKVWVTDHLIGAYCTNVARNGARSDTEKTEDVREFAGQVTHLVYNEDGVSDISLNVLLKPSVADAVNVKAQASGLSTELWMSRTIEAAAQAVSQSARLASMLARDPTRGNVPSYRPSFVRAGQYLRIWCDA